MATCRHSYDERLYCRLRNSSTAYPGPSCVRTWATPAEAHVLHSALATAPPRRFLPYLGDYIRLLAVGDDHYGVFSGANRPDHANFPSGVTYQRNANWTTQTLLGTDGTSGVVESIDPFFVHHTPGP